MNNNLKKQTIDIMVKLLGYARQLPAVCVDFYISADNRYIEKYIIEHTDRTDWGGKPLSSEEIDNNIRKRMRNFQNSEFYNPDGVSKLKMRKLFTLPEISYEKIYELVSNKTDDMPIGYKYVGELELSDFMRKQEMEE